MRKRKRKSVPVMLFWSKSEQARFIENVERFNSLVNDMEKVFAPVKRRRTAKEQPDGTPPTT